MTYQFSPIKFDNMGYIRESVFSILRNAILNANLEPGQRLVERDIAEQLQISRTPVREAIRKLESEKLVTHIPRKGVIVAGFTKEDIKEIQIIRISLEALSCSIAATKIKNKDLEQLNSIDNEMLKENQTIEKLSLMNRKFHETIYRAAESPRLYDFISTLNEYINNSTKVTYTKPGRLIEVFNEHTAVINALRSHDSDEAYNAAKIHVKKSSDLFLEMKYPKTSNI